MEHEEIHELTAAYALDALSDAEEAELEAHLRHCEQCRTELAAFHDTAAALAYGAPPASPPPALRAGILAKAREERGKVVTLRPRNTFRVLSAAAALAVIGLGIWAVAQMMALSEERTARNSLENTVSLLADPNTQRVPISGGEGTLVVAPDGQAALVLKDLSPAPAGRTYEAWVNESGSMRPAGIFEATGDTTVFVLNRSLPEGAGIAVTIEPEGGLQQPSGEPILTAETA